MRLPFSASLVLLFFVHLLLYFATFPSLSISLLTVTTSELVAGEINATADSNFSRSANVDDSFANIIDRALEREFTENEQSDEGLLIWLPLFFSLPSLLFVWVCKLPRSAGIPEFVKCVFVLLILSAYQFVVCWTLRSVFPLSLILLVSS